MFIRSGIEFWNTYLKVFWGIFIEDRKTINDNKPKSNSNSSYLLEIFANHIQELNHLDSSSNKIKLEKLI